MITKILGWIVVILYFTVTILFTLQQDYVLALVYGAVTLMTLILELNRS